MRDGSLLLEGSYLQRYCRMTEAGSQNSSKGGFNVRKEGITDID